MEDLTAALHTSPHCVWKPCRPTGDQLVTNKDTDEMCIPLPDCSNIILILGDNIIEDSYFEENIDCLTGPESECDSTRECITGTCNNLGVCDESSGGPSNGKPSNGKPSDNNIIIGIICIIVASLLVIGLAIWWLWK